MAKMISQLGETSCSKVRGATVASMKKMNRAPSPI